MACPDFEELLNGKRPEHARNCGRCQALLEAHAEVDSVFKSAFDGIYAPPGAAAAVRAGIYPSALQWVPSPVPEFLDLIGWAAVLAVAAMVTPRFISLLRPFLAGLG